MNWNEYLHSAGVILDRFRWYLRQKYIVSDGYAIEIIVKCTCIVSTFILIRSLHPSQWTCPVSKDVAKWTHTEAKKIPNGFHWQVKIFFRSLMRKGFILSHISTHTIVRARTSAGRYAQTHTLTHTHNHSHACLHKHTRARKHCIAHASFPPACRPPPSLRLFPLVGNKPCVTSHCCWLSTWWLREWLNDSACHGLIPSHESAVGPPKVPRGREAERLACAEAATKP